MLIGVRACAAVLAAFGAPFDAIRLRRAEASLTLPQCVAFHTDFSNRRCRSRVTASASASASASVCICIYIYIHAPTGRAQQQRRVRGQPVGLRPRCRVCADVASARHGRRCAPGPSNTLPGSLIAATTTTILLMPLFDKHAAVHINACACTASRPSAALWTTTTTRTRGSE